MKDNVGTKYFVMGWNNILKDWVQLGHIFKNLESAMKFANDTINQKTPYSSYGKVRVVRRGVQEFVLEEIGQ